MLRPQDDFRALRWAPTHCRGQAVVEFAIVALVVYLLLGAILTFGQWFYSGQTVQQAADVAAREISRTPLLATAQLMDVLYGSNPGDYSSSGGSSTVRAALFDPQLLQFDMTAGVPTGQSMLDVVQTWPIVNQMLYPAMIVQSGDQVYGGNAADQYLCYPGVVPCTDSTGPNRTVYCVARVDSRAADGAGDDNLGAGHRGNRVCGGPGVQREPVFRSAPDAGLSLLRINYGYQSASMTAFPPSSTYPPSPNGPPWVANDTEVAVNPSNYTPIGSSPPSAVGTYSGPYGLGTQEASDGWTQKDPIPPDAADAATLGRAALPQPDFGPGHLSPRGISIAALCRLSLRESSACFRGAKGDNDGL